MFGTRIFSARQIPGLVPGIFFLALGLAATAARPGVALELGRELLAEGQWAAARAEGLRAQTEATESADAASARLLASVAALRMGQNNAEVKAELGAVWQDEGAPLATRCAAAYELGGAVAERDRAGAFLPWKFAFLNATNSPLFWRSGCSLYFLLQDDAALRRAEPSLWRALLSCRDAWPLPIWRECRPRRQSGPGLASRPGQWIVSFYRKQIGPAIGARCDLEPSCSEYFRQASRTHGLLGIPIMADRFIREPTVVAAKEKPVVMPDGRIRYADPLSDHDAWMKGRP